MRVKSLLRYLIFIVVFQTTSAQESINFQALLLGDNGPIISSEVTVNLAIKKGVENNISIIFSESHTAMTDSSGVIALAMGSGTVLDGSWAAVDWSNNDLFIEVSLVEDGVSTVLSSSSVRSSPKALFAAKAGDVPDNSITTEKIANGSITLEKFADGVVLPGQQLTKEDIIALGIPAEDTNTTYSAGDGILIENDSIKLINSVIRSVDGVITAEKFIGDGSGLSGLVVDIQDGSIDSTKIADRSIAIDKLVLTKSDIVALGIPAEDTNTTYQPGPGILIVNDSIKLDSDAVISGDGFLEVEALLKRKNSAVSKEINLFNYSSIEEVFDDYHYYLGIDDTVSRQIVNETYADFSFSNELESKSLSLFTADNENRVLLEVSAPISDGEEPKLNVDGVLTATSITSPLITSALLESSQVSTDTLVVNQLTTSSGQGVMGISIENETEKITISADRFIGDGSQLTGIDTGVELVGGYQPFSGLYIESPTLSLFDSFKDDVEDVLLEQTDFSDLSTGALENFASTYLDGPNEDFPLVIGQVGDPQNPKGVVFGTAISATSIAAKTLRASEVSADRFVGDGSGLTNLEGLINSEPKRFEAIYDVRDSITVTDENLNSKATDDIYSLSDTISSYLEETDDDNFAEAMSVRDSLNFNYYLGEIDLSDEFEDEEYKVSVLNTEFVQSLFSYGLQGIFADLITKQLNIARPNDMFGLPVIMSDEDGDILINATEVQADTFIGDGSQLTGISASLPDGSVTASKIADGTISSEKIIDGTISRYDLADTSITTDKVAQSAITTSKIADYAVTADKIKDYTIEDGDISESANISFSKLDITKSDIEGLGISTLLLDGSVTSLKIADRSISSTKIIDNAVSTTKLADGSVTSDKVIDAAITESKIADSSVSSAKIIDGTIANADISDSASISFSKLDITKSDIEGLGISASLLDASVTEAKIADTSVSSAIIIDGTIANADISDSANISFSKLDITKSDIEGLGISASLLDASVTEAKIADTSVSSAKIIDGTIANADISDSASISFSKLNIAKSDIEGLGIVGAGSLGDFSNIYHNPSRYTFVLDVENDLSSADFSAGRYNLGIGTNTFSSLTTGEFNISYGNDNLPVLSGGSRNIAIGSRNFQVLQSNNDNIGIGYEVFSRLIGVDGLGGKNNIGLGYSAGDGLVSGNNNIAIGTSSLRSINGTNSDYTGSYNIAIGYGAGRIADNLDYTGSDSIFIGNSSGPASSMSEGIAIGRGASIGPYSVSIGNSSKATDWVSVAIGDTAQALAQNSIAIGYGAKVEASSPNTMALGGSTGVNAIKKIINTTADIEMKSFITTSDARLKKDIEQIKSGLGIISNLNPVYYSKRGNLESNEFNSQEYGFIAQEVQKILPEVVKNTGGEDQLLGLDYNSFIAILTKALQEQQSEIDLLKEQVKFLMEKE